MEISMSSSDGFVPQIESMDLRSLYDQIFIVAISTGARDDGRLLAKTIHGPYSFDEMVGEVGRMWNDSQDNAKVYVLEKDHKKKSKWLDAKTIDYIQAKYVDIIMERLIGSEDRSYTVEAGVVEDREPEIAQQETENV
jgi:hypothetical protein